MQAWDPTYIQSCACCADSLKTFPAFFGGAKATYFVKSVYAFLSLSLSVCVCMPSCMHVCVCVYVCADERIRARMDPMDGFACMRNGMLTCIQAYTRTHPTNTHTHTCAHTQTCTHKYTYTHIPRHLHSFIHTASTVHGLLWCGYAWQAQYSCSFGLLCMARPVLAVLGFYFGLVVLSGRHERAHEEEPFAIFYFD